MPHPLKLKPEAERLDPSARGWKVTVHMRLDAGNLLPVEEALHRAVHRRDMLPRLARQQRPGDRAPGMA